MSDPITFASSTPVLGLPLLMAGQAQKEFFVNQALSLLDALHPRSITASQPAPPANPAEGESYRVTAPAEGGWAGQENRIAVLIGGAWHFIAPQAGMQVFDRASGSLLTYRSQWHRAAAPAAPAGGTVVDAEARTAIAALTAALTALGVLAPHSP